jgi:hypothetical protein
MPVRKSTPQSIVQGDGALYAAIVVNGGIVDASDLTQREIAVAVLRLADTAATDVRLTCGRTIFQTRTRYGRQVVLVAKVGSVAGRDAIRKCDRVARGDIPVTALPTHCAEAA